MAADGQDAAATQETPAEAAFFEADIGPDDTDDDGAPLSPAARQRRRQQQRAAREELERQAEARLAMTQRFLSELRSVLASRNE